MALFQSRRYVGNRTAWEPFRDENHSLLITFLQKNEGTLLFEAIALVTESIQ